MATPAQVIANRKNAQLSTGPTSIEGLMAAARNHLGHGLCSVEHFTLLPEENGDKFNELSANLKAEHNPQTETESVLVRRMAESQWLVARALRLQTSCLTFGAQDPNTNKLALFLRYQTTHERAFYKALNELQNLRQQTVKTEIGFESKRLKQSAESRASESLNLRKDQFQFKKEVFQSKKGPSPTRPVPETSPDGLKMAA